MTYENMKVADIYLSMPKNRVASTADYWVEAENIFTVRAIFIDWFNAMEDGSAANRYPDLNDATYIMEDADKLVKELDADFDIEKRRYHGLKVEAGPGYERLAPHSRLAFAQEVFGAVLSESEIYIEAKRRLEAGETIPPEDAKVVSIDYWGWEFDMMQDYGDDYENVIMLGE